MNVKFKFPKKYQNFFGKLEEEEGDIEKDYKN